jgi:hypothetical protein
MKPLGGKISFGKGQDPASFLQEGRADVGEWYAVAKGKDGACGVFARKLVRVSWYTGFPKKFKFYEPIGFS